MTALTPHALARVGTALFGPQWQTPLAKALGMNDRSMRYLASGGRPVSVGMVRDIAAIVKERGEGLKKVAAMLEKVLSAIPD